MAQPGLADRETEQQVLRTPPDALDPLALERLDDAFRKREAQVLAVEGHLVDARAGELGLEAAADGFDFGQFGHNSASPA